MVLVCHYICETTVFHGFIKGLTHNIKNNYTSSRGIGLIKSIGRRGDLLVWSHGVLIDRLPQHSPKVECFAMTISTVIATNCIGPWEGLTKPAGALSTLPIGFVDRRAKVGRYPAPQAPGMAKCKILVTIYPQQCLTAPYGAVRSFDLTVARVGQSESCIVLRFRQIERSDGTTFMRDSLPGDSQCDGGQGILTSLTARWSYKRSGSCPAEVMRRWACPIPPRRH